jgi:hypothetical protein
MRMRYRVLYLYIVQYCTGVPYPPSTLQRTRTQCVLKYWSTVLYKMHCCTEVHYCMLKSYSVFSIVLEYSTVQRSTGTLLYSE